MIFESLRALTTVFPKMCTIPASLHVFKNSISSVAATPEWLGWSGFVELPNCPSYAPIPSLQVKSHSLCCMLLRYIPLSQNNHHIPSYPRALHISLFHHKAWSQNHHHFCVHPCTHTVSHIAEHKEIMWLDTFHQDPLLSQYSVHR
jgi:hypothetical protein